MMKNENIVTVIDALGDTIAKQKDDIFFKDLQIRELNEKLAAAEKELADFKNATKCKQGATQ